MSHHIIRFLKDICDDTGHTHHCTQGVVEIHEARSYHRAIEAAKLRFARQRRIGCWDQHADRFEVEGNSDETHPGRN